MKQKSDILPNMLLVITISQKCNTLISPITYQLPDFPQVLQVNSDSSENIQFSSMSVRKQQQFPRNFQSAFPF